MGMIERQQVCPLKTVSSEGCSRAHCHQIVTKLFELRYRRMLRVEICVRIAVQRVGCICRCRRTRAIEPQRAEFFLHLEDGEAGIRVANERFETQVVEACRPTAVLVGLALAEKSGSQPRQPVTFCFLDNDPMVRVLGPAGAFFVFAFPGKLGRSCK